jgi:hypothetical protein
VLEKLLSLLFPVRLPGKIEYKQPAEFQEQGSCGEPKIKKYRNGIERYFAENE